MLKDDAPRQVIGHRQGHRARDKHREPIAHDVDARAGAQFFRPQQFRPVGVQDDVLAGAAERDHERDGAEGRKMLRRIQRRHHRQ
jgi:hypothetical protein